MGLYQLSVHLQQVQKQMAREYEQLKATVSSLKMFQHEGDKVITPMVGSKSHFYYSTGTYKGSPMLLKTVDAHTRTVIWRVC